MSTVNSQVTGSKSGPNTAKLEDQAAAAALYVSSDAKSKQTGQNIFDSDGKLSSASAATSLKYAKAQDLPSFPSTGLKMSSAGAAASLADGNKKSVELWRPGSIPAANKAAMLAKDYEMDPLWQPELSAAGSKAALLASRDTTTIEPYRAPKTKEGQSAADQALGHKPKKDTARDIPADVHNKALMAATGAMAGSRARAGSAPQKPVDNTSWAMKAANKSHKDAPIGGAFASGDPGFEAARIQNQSKKNVNRQMYGSAPPVSIEVDEKNHQDQLRASAVAMAQKMYAIQQTQINEAAGTAANRSHHRSMSDTSSEAEVVVKPRYEGLEEAARKLAQERLAKLHDEHAEYRQYYGAKSPPRSRLSMRLGRGGAAPAAGSDDDSDQEQSRKIRQQMSIFQSNVNAVDTKKRQADRDALLEIAHKNVEARMSKMDDKIFQETGKASPAQKEMWEKQARERAQARMDEANKNYGKVHIGGGKYLDQSEVDAIAKARLQPTFDDIDAKVKAQKERDDDIRARQEAARLEAERRHAETARDKAREAENKAEVKAQQDKSKRDAKARKEEEKIAQREGARQERGRLGREENTTGAQTEHETSITTSAPTVAVDSTVHDAVTMPTEESARRSYEPPIKPIVAAESVESPTKRDSKVRSWFKTRILGETKTQKDEPIAASRIAEPEKPADSTTRDEALVGGTEEPSTIAASADPVSPVHDSAVGASGARDRSPSISPVSDVERDAVVEAPATTTTIAAEEPTMTTTTTTTTPTNMSDSGFAEPNSSKDKGKGISKLFSKIRGTKETEDPKPLSTERTGSASDDFQEGQDTFVDAPTSVGLVEKETDKLELPAPHHDSAAGGARVSSSSHDRSKFTEEL